jgi:hypothetical protein
MAIPPDGRDLVGIAPLTLANGTKHADSLGLAPVLVHLTMEASE